MAAPSSDYGSSQWPVPDQEADRPSPSPPHGSQLVRYGRDGAEASSSPYKALGEALRASVAQIDVREAEELLSRKTLPSDPERDILSLLQNPGPEVPAWQAACDTLNAVARASEDFAFYAVYIYRLIAEHSMWEGHPDRSIRSLSDLVASFDLTVNRSLALGVSVHRNKRYLLTIIDESWGAGWFDRIPSEQREPLWSAAADLSIQLLKNIAARAKQGIRFDEALEDWTEQLRLRTDYRARRTHNIRGSTAHTLQPQDVAHSGIASQALEGELPATSVVLLDVIGDGWTEKAARRAAVRQKHAQSKQSLLEPEHSQTARNRKRRLPDKHRGAAQTIAPEAEQQEGDWELTPGREHERRKKGRYGVERRRVAGPERTPDPLDMLNPVLNDRQGRAAADKAWSPPADRISNWTTECQGPGIAESLRTAARTLAAAQRPLAAGRIACECCFIRMDKGIRAFRETVMPLVRQLEEVVEHRVNGAIIPSTKEITVADDEDFPLPQDSRPSRRRLRRPQGRVILISSAGGSEEGEDVDKRDDDNDDNRDRGNDEGRNSSDGSDNIDVDDRERDSDDIGSEDDDGGWGDEDDDDDNGDDRDECGDSDGCDDGDDGRWRRLRRVRRRPSSRAAA